MAPAIAEPPTARKIPVSAPVTEPVPVTTPVTPEQHQETVDLLKGRCLEMAFTVHGLPKNRRIGGKAAEQIASTVKGKIKGIRSSWSLFSSDHPAVKELNQAVRELVQLRDSWTIVRSAEVNKGTGTIEGGKRLIWDADHEEFYRLFVTKAKVIDLCVVKVEHALNHRTNDDNGNEVMSIKDMDKENAGDAWNDGAYPATLLGAVGVAKECAADGKLQTDAGGEPIYIIHFDEYHVSERLCDTLRERAVHRLDQKLGETIETAMCYAVNELTEDLTTFMSELVNRVRIFPLPKHPWHVYAENGEPEVLKIVDHSKDRSVPSGQVKVLISYKEAPAKDSEEEPTVVRRWLGPIPLQEYEDQVRPQSTGEKKKIYPAVIEGIIAKMESFRDKKARMLGQYGANVVASFDELLTELTKHKRLHMRNDEAAQKLAGTLRTSDEAKEGMADVIADTIAALDTQTVEVKKMRRQVMRKLIGKV